MSRNEISENIGISTRAIIDLAKKLESLGYLDNVSGKLKASEKWISTIEEARSFLDEDGEETSLGPVEAQKSEETSGEETSLSDEKSEETSLGIQSIVKKVHHDADSTGEETSLSKNFEVKKVHHYTNDSEESSPGESDKVKKVHRQNQEISELIQESEETSPEESSPGDLYIYTNNLNNNLSKEDKDIVEKGCGEKQKPYFLTFKDEVATCEILRASCLSFHADHPEKYSTEMYRKFIRHWSTPDKKGVPKWYKEQTAKRGTWNLPGRLVTWYENDQKFNSNKNSNGKSYQRAGSALRPTSIAEPSKRIGSGNVAHVEF